ncbi:MAG: pantoate--beta-alanine ligase [Tannerella sp.]|jgi:pantoate--beta-alanine ligase|nr:pantoate--beta-alanine ligase [Tannerella sp.]
MRIFLNIKELQAALAAEREAAKTVGFVPTMGALHRGHISLVEQCKQQCGVCVVSIFVNPTQFNDKNDLHAYPRTLEADCELLLPTGCDYVFAPSEAEMYPEPDTRVFHLGAVADVMEGAFRAGHFNGVAQVVSKLFDIVQPDCAFFGEKDFQQIAVIREMCRQLGSSVQIVPCPIVREDDGLALSSRNARLTPEQRQIAPLISHILKDSCIFAAAKRSVKETELWCIAALNLVQPLRVEYFEIVDGDTLQPLADWDASKNPVGCITVFCGDVRLIDNVKY